MAKPVQPGSINAATLAFVFFFFKSAAIPLPGFDAGFVFVVASIYAFNKRHKQVRISAAGTSLILFWAWACLSFIWRGHDNVLPALLSWLNTAFDLLAIYLIFRLGSPMRIAEQSVLGVLWGGVAVSMQVLFFAARGLNIRDANSDFLGANYIGGILGLCLLCAIYVINHEQNVKKRIHLSIMAAAVGISLFYSLSKTAILAFLLASFVFFIISAKSIKAKLRGLSLVILVGGAAFFYLSDYLGVYLLKAQDGEALESLSGRTFIWLEAIDSILDKPFFGYGVRSFADYGPQIADVQLVHAHNEILQTLFAYGAIGLTFLLGSYVFFLKRVITLYSHSKKSNAQAAFGVAIVTFALTRGITEAHDAATVVPLHIFFLLCLWNANTAINNPIPRSPASAP